MHISLDDINCNKKFKSVKEFLYFFHQFFNLELNSNETFIDEFGEKVLPIFLIDESNSQYDILESRYQEDSDAYFNLLNKFNLVDRFLMLERIMNEAKTNSELRNKLSNVRITDLISDDLGRFDYFLLDKLKRFNSTLEFEPTCVYPDGLDDLSNNSIEFIILRYLSLSINPKDNLSLGNVANQPNRGIDQYGFKTIRKISKKLSISDFQMLVSYVNKLDLGRNDGFDPKDFQILNRYSIGIKNLTNSISKIQDILSGIAQETDIVVLNANQKDDIYLAKKSLSTAIIHVGKILKSLVNGVKPVSDVRTFSKEAINREVEALSKRLEDLDLEDWNCETIINDTPQRTEGQGATIRGRLVIKLTKLILVLFSNSKTDNLNLSASLIQTPSRITSRMKNILNSPETPKSTQRKRKRHKQTGEPAQENQNLNIEENSLNKETLYQSDYDWANNSQLVQLPEIMIIPAYDPIEGKKIPVSPLKEQDLNSDPEKTPTKQQKTAIVKKDFSPKAKRNSIEKKIKMPSLSKNQKRLSDFFK